MIILVTGAAGFLGRNIVAYLAATHPTATILATDLHSAGEHITPLDVRDPAACFDLLERTHPTHVVHAAAITGPATSDQMFSVNVQGTANMLEAAVRSSVQRFLLLSSSGVYDQSTSSPTCAEDDPLNLSSLYAQTKYQAEVLLAQAASSRLTAAAARIGPVYGPFERPSITRPNISIIQQLCNCLQARQPVQVLGSDSPRDWTCASEIARALEAILLAPQLLHRVYNVGSGISISSRQILDFFRGHGLRLSATGVPIAFDPELSRKPLCITRLQNETGFRPVIDLTTGLTQLLKHS